MIADVGIAKFHADETAKRQAQGKSTTNKYETLRYAPPKTEIGTSREGEQTSRRYDSWSLGCILLEFIIWLLRGSDGLLSFDEESHKATPPLETFWIEGYNRKPMLHPVVSRWIKKELPKGHKTDTALLELLKIVASKLLIIEVNSRIYVSEFCDSLRHIQKKCADDPAYLWNGPDNGLTPSRKSPEEGTEEYVGPKSQRVGS